MRIRQALIPRTNANRPGLPLYGGQPDYLTVHETGNRDAGANAEMHRRFTHNGGGTDQVSFHWTVDDTEAIQLLPHDETAWHAGDSTTGAGNRDSIAIEVCVNADGDWARTLANLVALLARLCRELGLGPERIVQHNRWSGKNCPERLRRGEWPGLISAVRAALQPDAARASPAEIDAVLERAWWANRRLLGDKRDPGAGQLRRDWGGRKILLCRRGALAYVDGQGAVDITERLMDDLVTILEARGELVRFGG